MRYPMVPLGAPLVLAMAAFAPAEAQAFLDAVTVGRTLAANDKLRDR